MTSLRKNRLRAKIQASRERLLDRFPFFALMLMYLKFVAVPDMKKISTNANCIYFSPDFLDKLYGFEVDFILCHQVMHILCGHLWRPLDREGIDYHFACDILINAYLKSIGLWEKRYPHLGEVFHKLPGREPEETLFFSEEDIYCSLSFSLYQLEERTRNKFLCDSDQFWKQQEDFGALGEIVLDLPEMSGRLSPEEEQEEQSKPEEKKAAPKSLPSQIGKGSQKMPDQIAASKAAWHERACAAAKIPRTLAAGSAPDFMERVIEKLVRPTLDWKKILHHFLQEELCDYSFSPPDRRFSASEFFLPDFNESDFTMKEILFMVDTSASISSDDLSVIYSEIIGALDQFSGKLMGKLGFFDCAVTPPLPFSSLSTLKKIIPYGGGGTDFRVIFEFLNNSSDPLPAKLIIFTDGFGPFPQESETLGIPILWIIYQSMVQPPFGKVAYLMPPEEE